MLLNMFYKCIVTRKGHGQVSEAGIRETVSLDVDYRALRPRTRVSLIIAFGAIGSVEGCV